MAQEIIPLIQESTSIINLEERLRHSGRIFRDYREYIKWLGTKWDQGAMERAREVLETSLTETKFPTLTVGFEGVEYQLHGLVHGGHFLVTPGWHLRKRVREYIEATMAQFHKPEHGEDYLYEENAHRLFNLLRTQELKDVTNASPRSDSYWKDFGKFLAALPFAVICPFVFGMLYLSSKSIRNPRSKSSLTLYLMQKALTDERYQFISAEVDKILELPQPLNLEKGYLANKNSAHQFVTQLYSGNYNLVTTPERSLWTARELRKYSQDKNLATLHYLGGAGHTTEIAYFLQHPHFSFERLEEYRVRRR